MFYIQAYLHGVHAWGEDVNKRRPDGPKPAMHGENTREVVKVGLAVVIEMLSDGRIGVHGVGIQRIISSVRVVADGMVV
jgi:hypothetical protein